MIVINRLQKKGFNILIKKVLSASNLVTKKNDFNAKTTENKNNIPDTAGLVSKSWPQLRAFLTRPTLTNLNPDELLYYLAKVNLNK